MSFYFLEATAFAKLFVREPGTDALIRLLETVEDNRKLISAASPWRSMRRSGSASAPGKSPLKPPPRRLRCCALKQGEWSSSP